MSGAVSLLMNRLKQWFPKWAVLHPGGGGDKGQEGGKGRGGGPFKSVVRLFTIEVTSGQKLGNWHHFIKPIHRIKNLLTVN
jgi:hypothetical protein